MLILKKSLITKFMAYGNNTSSLQTLFKLIQEDLEAHPSSNEVKELGVKILKRGFKHITRRMLGSNIVQTGNRRRYYIPGRDGPTDMEGAQLFTAMGNLAATLGRSDLVRDALQVAMSRPSWSDELLKIVAERMAREISENVPNVWNRWYVPTLCKS